MWQKIRGIFKKGSPEAPVEVVAPPAEPESPVGTDEDFREGGLAHISDLLEAILLANEGSEEFEKIISRLRNVADSHSALPESRAFALVGIGETYMRMETPEAWELARRAFTELIDSESQEEAWRLRALVHRAMVESQSQDFSVLNNALRDTQRVLESPILHEIEENFVCRASCVRGVAFEKLGNASLALRDYQHVLDTASYETRFRIAAFTHKVNLLASQDRWMDEAEACLDAIRSTGDAEIVEVAMGRFSDLWEEREDWDFAVLALNTLEDREGLTERERYSILTSRMKASMYRNGEDDLQRQIDDMTSLIENCELSGHEFATKVMARFSMLALLGHDVSGDQHIHDFEQLLETPGAATHQYGGADCILGRLYAARNTEEDLNKAVHHWSRALRSPHLSDTDRVVALMDRAKVYVAFELFDGAISDYSEVIEMGDKAPDEIIAMAQDLRSAAQAGQRSSSDFTAVDRAGGLSDAEVEEAVELARHHAFSPIGNGPREGLRILRGLIENPNLSDSAKVQALAQRAFLYAAHPEVKDLRQTIRDTTSILEIPDLEPNEIAVALINRASAYVERRNPGDIESAFADLRRCAAMQDADQKHVATANSNLGRMCEGLGDYPGALDNFGRVLPLLPASDPLVLHARIFRGNYFLGTNLFEQAIPEYDAVLDTAHGEVKARVAALHGRASVFSALGDVANEVADLSSALNLPDLSPEEVCIFACRRGLALLKSRIPEELVQAERDFQSVLDSEEASRSWRAAAYFGQGLVCYRREEPATAITFFTAALDYDELEGKYRILTWANRAKAFQMLNDSAYRDLELSDYDELIDIGEYLDPELLSFAVESRRLRFPEFSSSNFDFG